MKRSPLLLTFVGLIALAMGCAPAESTELLEDPDALDQAVGTWELSADGEETAAARVPIKYLGCTMGVQLTLRLDEGDADVNIADLDYYSGLAKNPRGGDDMHVYGDIMGGSVNGTLSDDWNILGYDPLGSRESSATFMLVDAGDYRGVGGGGCDHVDYSGQRLSGRSLVFGLELVDGASAKVSYDIEYFDCSSYDRDGDPRQVEICDAAWDSLYDRIVGKTYEVSSCPSGYLSRENCGLWESIWGNNEKEYTEEDVHAATDKVCRDNRELMSASCRSC